MEHWNTRKSFLLLTEEDEQGLKLIQPLMDRCVDELVEAFYQHLLGFSETRKLLTDQLITTRLKDAQKMYLRSIVSGPYDEAYRDSRFKIGQVHDRIGLTPQWYLGAYSLYLTLLQPLVLHEFRNRPADADAVLSALTKVVFLDIQLAIEAYIQKSSEKLEFSNRQLAELSRNLGKGLQQKQKDLQDTQYQLRQTERLAELGTLASGMAHEIGTPMNVILGRAEHLMQRTTDERVQKGLEIIIAQVERITKIMNQLLTFARRCPIERRLIDLRRTIADCLEVVQERIARHRITVETVFADDMPLAFADSDQMSQVLLNLMINALHAMPNGGVLRISLSRAGARLKLVVGDTGHGIATDDLAKIFNPFFTTKEVGKGTGLGLTVVHGIVHEHGGTIEVDSEPGRGTTFTISLPLALPSQSVQSDAL
ncbi:MAG TPA: protoglobin domain-containing protein [Nitrospiraceae bacterium]|nr:protoglobin domain-containing protein [Nitrospiraceae bacterium]